MPDKMQSFTKFAGRDIITVGFSPAWDVTCIGNDLKWNTHPKLESTEYHPAGKALNICKALDWMGTASTAAGLWGSDDLGRAESIITKKFPNIAIKFTPVAGSTRNNITIIDLQRKLEMHLRNKSKLANKSSLSQLKEDLLKVIGPKSICVFAGAFWGENLSSCMEIIEFAKETGALIVVDTSGPALKECVRSGYCDLIKPNVKEFCHILGKDVPDRSEELKKLACKLLGDVDILLISRGSRGVVLVSTGEVISAKASSRLKLIRSTVGCGDYLLAGFLDGLVKGRSLKKSLELSTQTATAKAMNLTDKKFNQAVSQIEVVTS